MVNALRNSRGFTLAEMVMAAFFGLILVGSLYGFYRDQLFSLLSQDARTGTLQDARSALDLMVRELRGAGAWASGSAPSGCSRIVTANATTIRIQADLDGNGDCASATGEDVTYSLSGATATCPGTTIRRNGDCLLANVVLPGGSAFLTYYGAGSGAPLDLPLADLTVPRRVRIVLGVQVKNPDARVGGTIVSNLASSVDFRN